MASKKRVIEIINSILSPHTIANSYENKVSDWCNKYELKFMKEAIEIAKTNYLTYDDGKVTEASALEFLGKLGGIIHNLDKSPIEKEIIHIVNKLPYIFPYYKKDKAREKLDEYVYDLRSTYNLNDKEIINNLKMELDSMSLYKNWTTWLNHFAPKVENSDEIKTFIDLRDYLIENGIDTIFGKINDIKKRIGQGGNSIVCFGTLNDDEIAIKLLINYDQDKKNRFLLEYYNIIKSITNFEGIVNQYFLGEIKIGNYIFPYIVMKKYKSQLLFFDNIEIDKLFNYSFQLARSLGNINSHGIVHRDLKPQNILVDDNDKLFISDFGIAYFDPNDFD